MFLDTEKFTGRTSEKTNLIFDSRLNFTESLLNAANSWAGARRSNRTLEFPQGLSRNLVSTSAAGVGPRHTYQ